MQGIAVSIDLDRLGMIYSYAVKLTVRLYLDSKEWTRNEVFYCVWNIKEYVILHTTSKEELSGYSHLKHKALRENEFPIIRQIQAKFWL